MCVSRTVSMSPGGSPLGEIVTTFPIRPEQFAPPVSIHDRFAPCR